MLYPIIKGLNRILYFVLIDWSNSGIFWLDAELVLPKYEFRLYYTLPIRDRVGSFMLCLSVAIMVTFLGWMLIWLVWIQSNLLFYTMFYGIWVESCNIYLQQQSFFRIDADFILPEFEFGRIIYVITNF